MERLNLTDISNLTEEECRLTFEGIRWPNGVVCPRCSEAVAVVRISGKSARPGLYRCNTCNREKRNAQFTVKVGTVMEDSPIRYKTWLMAFCMETSSKKGYSSHQMARNLGVTQKTAWFLGHRIRHAMETSPNAPLLGGPGGVVEVDETYIGGKPRTNYWKDIERPWTLKTPVVALVDRAGRVRSMPKDRVTAENLKAAIRENVDPDSRIMTDEHQGYVGVGKEFASHETVCHGRKEYVRGDVTTNTVEAYFALLKRGIHGTFHHLSKTHLHRYCNEFDFRWSHRKASDTSRLIEAIAQSEGKRLTWAQPSTEVENLVGLV